MLARIHIKEGLELSPRLADFVGVVVIQELAGRFSHDGIAIKVEALCTR